MPNDGDDVIVDGNAIFIESGGFYPGNSNTFNGNIIIRTGAWLIVREDIVVNGTITVEAGGTLDLDRFATSARGSITMGSGSSLTLEAGASVRSDCSTSPTCATDDSGGFIQIDGGIVYDPGNGIGPGEFFTETVTTTYTGDQTLPVELISFVAHAHESDQVIIEWETASELNNDYFTLQRSENGIHWEDLFEVEGAGTTSERQYYMAIDYNPIVGLSYYRLKQTDFDGAFECFEAVAVNFQPSPTEVLSVYPNPTTGMVYLTGPTIDPASIATYQASGQRLDTQVQPGNNGRLALDLSGNPAGVYLIRTDVGVRRIVLEAPR